MKHFLYVSLILLAACGKTAGSRDAVLTGTIDQNLVGIAGKPVAVAAEGVQKIALADEQISQDPCDGNPGLGFNIAITDTNAKALVPPMSGKNAHLCSIHANGIYKVELMNQLTLLEGGGSSCNGSPTYLIGDSQPANGAWIAGGGNGGFIEGGAGATIYRTTGANRGICVRGLNSNRVNVSGTYLYK